MKNDSNVPQEITHPETGAKMVLDTRHGSRVLEQRLTRDIGIPEGGRLALERIREKEREAGHLYVDPVTGYQHRHKADGGQANSSARQDDRGGERSQASQGEQGESVDQKRQRLQRELAALDPHQ